MAHRVGRLFVVGFEGTDLPAETVAFAERFGLGGVILFRRNCESAESVQRVIRSVKVRLFEVDPGGPHLVMVDQEGGRVERILDGVPHLPPAREIGQAGAEAVEKAARDQALALRRLGIDVNLAPVCDVVQEGESGVIGDRSYGADPTEVASLAAAFVRGTLRGGVLPCAKHFPGHGAASVDSHKNLPVIGKSFAELEEFDLPPFASAVAAGVPLVMSAHLVCASLSVGPATLCRTWITEVLRRRLGFQGAVLTDDLEMGALGGLGKPEEVALRAHRAGCDLLLYGRVLRPELDLVAVAEALEREVSEPGFMESMKRISLVSQKLK